MKEKNPVKASEEDLKTAFFQQLLRSDEQKVAALKPLYVSWIETLMGPMIAIADEELLYVLEFMSKKGLEKELLRLQRLGYRVLPGETAILTSIQKELDAYFSGTLKSFQTPYRLLGTPFQQQVWNALSQIPYGHTLSYAEEATFLGKPTAYRAVANANGANQLTLIIPCHRVIASDGGLGGYSCGIAIKQWLLDHERQHLDK